MVHAVKCTIGKVANEVPSYLKLPNWNEFSEHCLRRTSATLLVYSGADVASLKPQERWKSNSMAYGYVEESLQNKKDITVKILVPNALFAVTVSTH